MTILTKYGEMEENLLERREYVEDRAQIVEYYLHFELVHRSAAVQLQGIQGAAALQQFA